MLARPNLLSSFPPITYTQPQHYHAIAHSFAQRQSANPLSIKRLRTLSIATGVAPLLRVAHPARRRTTYGLSPLESAFTPNGLLTPLESAFTQNRGVGRVTESFPDQNKRAMYSRIMCFQYGQSCPPSGPQLSSEWRMPLPPRTSDRRYDGPEFSHCPVPVAI
jgi:hypothetical protein